MNNSTSQYNWRILVFYYIFTSAALTVVANVTLMDFLLLRMKIDLVKFGLIKSSMYFLPALSYLAATPLLQRLKKEQQICAWAYLLRLLLPLPLPLLPLISSNQNFLVISVMVITSLSFSCAMFANNSLVIIQRKTLQGKGFSRKVSLLNTLLSVPNMILGFPVALFFSSLTDISDRNFFLLFAAVQFVFTIPGIPAARKFLRLKLDNSKQQTPGRYRWRSLLLPFKDPQYRMILLFCFTHLFWYALISTYWAVYLLKTWSLSITAVVALEMILVLALLALAAPAGRIIDRFGYPEVCFVSSLVCLVCTAVFCIFPGSWLTLALFGILVHAGYNGIISGTMRFAWQADATKLLSLEYANVYVLILSMVQMIACFTGSILAGKLFAVISARVPEDSAFRWYWIACGLILILLTWQAHCWKKKNT